jgi:chloride channel protein, CIC family
MMGTISNKKIAGLIETHLVSVSPKTTANTAFKLLKTSNLSLVPVIENGRLVGIVFYDDLELNIRPDESIAKLMKSPLFVDKNKSIDYAIKYILSKNMTRVPVVDSSIGMRCIGMLSVSSLLKEKKIAAIKK